MMSSNTNAVNFGDLRMYVASPGPNESCYVQSPNPQTVSFAGKFINLSEISRTAGLDPSYLSRIFRGERMPTVSNIRKISEALGMQLQEFLDAWEAHVRDRKAAERRNRLASIRRNESWLRRKGLL